MKKILSLAVSLFLAGQALAETDTIRVANQQLQTRYLKPVSRQYLVYRQRTPGSSKKQLSVWERNVDVKNNQVQISQKWFGADTITRQLFSVCDSKDLRPVYHYVKNFRNEVEAYTFNGRQTIGTDSVSKNLKKDFRNEWKEPAFNWELDMETFALLPLKKDKKFVIPFYHPGSSTGPAYYLYEVAGEEKIRIGNEKLHDCWLLKINYSDENYATFWIDKKEKEVLKMEEFFNGWYRYKIKLPAVDLGSQKKV
ncbi:hypothetical protein [Adhaeribacter terreus]|uniref:DUF3108 domain-containing protein n=1 Tax=Adhaeribacter terreus TaxID=529703 RepID=A0ABW0E6A4_9BACT